MKYYFDNASTSYPKPKEVINSLSEYYTKYGATFGRTGGTFGTSCNLMVLECRELLCDFFNFNKADNVIFTSGITNSINTLLLSAVKKDWHIITSSLEHNSVIRPLETLKRLHNAKYDILQCDNNGFISFEGFKSLLKPNTKLVILTQASNVIGTIQPLKEIGAYCKKNNIFFIVDTAQSAGKTFVDMNSLNCDALTFTGHKGLMASQGIGGFIISDTFNNECNPIFTGGTGSHSQYITQPEFLPDKFESGTLNLPGIYSLYSALKFIKKEGLENIIKREQYLYNYFLEKLLNINRIKFYGSKEASNSTFTFSINIDNLDSSELGFILENQYNIITRSGLHCSPLAHKSIGTFPCGTVRFSLGNFNTKDEIDYVINSLYKISKL